VRVEEHTIDLSGAPAFFRIGRPDNGRTAPLPVYLHGAPTSSDDWGGVLDRTGGLAPDLLGFGRSAKGGHLEYSPESLADFVSDLLTDRSIDRCQLVLHGWGAAAGLLLAARRPERVERVVLFNSVPLLPGLAWPGWARLLRIRALGELTMGSITKTALTRWLRQGSVAAGAWPRDRIDQVWEQFDQGTQRAILRLQRSVDEERQRDLAASLGSLHMPVLIVWGERDPWYGPEVLKAYADRLPKARIERLPGAGHWPWLDDQRAVALLTEFLGAVPGSTGQALGQRQGD
jgi:pimeloyl-ACP methyl ester carboxylesterase